jgi:uncharacterized OB-fold protein
MANAKKKATYETRQCKNCGEDMKPKRGHREFCNTSCRVQYWQQHNLGTVEAFECEFGHPATKRREAT